MNYHYWEKIRMDYRLVRSSRRTLAAEIARGGEIIVRAPMHMPISRIEAFLHENEKKICEAAERAKNATPSYSQNDKEAEELIKRAKEVIPQRVEYFSKLMGLEPAGVSITSAQKRFGSCSSKGRLCFSFNLMQYPDEAVDYVVVHELVHLKELNHSKKFWAIVESYLPDYKSRRAMLRR